MTHPTDDELEAMAARLEASAYVRSPAHEIEAAAMLRACKGITVPDALDPDMPAQALKLHMGEMSAAEQRTARAAIRWANSRLSPAPDVRGAQKSAATAMCEAVRRRDMEAACDALARFDAALAKQEDRGDG